MIKEKDDLYRSLPICVSSFGSVLFKYAKYANPDKLTAVEANKSEEKFDIFIQ